MLRYSGLYQEGCADLMVQCQVFADGRPLALPVHTCYKAFTNRWKWVPCVIVVVHCVTKQWLFSWNEWVTLPVTFRDLPRSALLAITIYDCAGPREKVPLGGTTISLFGKHGVFRQVSSSHTYYFFIIFKFNVLFISNHLQWNATLQLIFRQFNLHMY